MFKSILNRIQMDRDIFINNFVQDKKKTITQELLHMNSLQ